MLRILIYVFVALVTLALAALAFLFMANRQDEPLSEAARVASIYQAPTAQQRQNNGFLTLFGADAVVSDAPASTQDSADNVRAATQLGQQRLAASIAKREALNRPQVTSANTNTNTSISDLNLELSEVRSKVLHAQTVYPDALFCPSDAANCVQWLKQQPEANHGALEPVQKIVHQRMLAATDAPDFSDLFPNFYDSQNPPFDLLTRWHRMQLKQADRQWLAGELEAALGTLEQTEKLRRRLENTAASSPSAMQAKSMQFHTIKWVSNAVSESGNALKPEHASRLNALLDKPYMPIAKAMQGDMQAHLTFFATFRNTVQLSEDTNASLDSDGRWWAARAHEFFDLLYLPNQSSNESAQSVQLQIQLAQQPTEQHDQAVKQLPEQLSALKASHSRWLGARNIVGNYLLKKDAPDYVARVERAIDLEGYRRLALLQLKARTEQVDPEKMSHWLAASPATLSNPYSGERMQWHAESRTLEFTGHRQQRNNPNRSHTYRIALAR